MSHFPSNLSTNDINVIGDDPWLTNETGNAGISEEQFQVREHSHLPVQDLPIRSQPVITPAISTPLRSVPQSNIHGIIPLPNATDEAVTLLVPKEKDITDMCDTSSSSASHERIPYNTTSITRDATMPESASNEANEPGRFPLNSERRGDECHVSCHKRGDHDGDIPLDIQINSTLDQPKTILSQDNNYNTPQTRPSQVQIESIPAFITDVSRQLINISRDPVRAGGYCDIHEATLQGVGRIALKKLRYSDNLVKAKKRFRYEAEIWSRLDHPHVLQFLGICQIGPIMYLASPWQSNGNMSEYLKVYPDFDRYTLITRVAGAVNYLHLNEPSIVHGDIKGSNIMISARGEPLLCDFGLSIILSEIPFIEDVPSGLHDAGSLRYSAPELLVGNGAEDLKTRESDTFAFAMLIIEAFTSAPPFANILRDMNVIYALIRGDRPEKPDALDNPTVACTILWEVIELCWQTIPSNRPAMNDIHEALVWIQGENYVLIPPAILTGLKEPTMPVIGDRQSTRYRSSSDGHGVDQITGTYENHSLSPRTIFSIRCWVILSISLHLIAMVLSICQVLVSVQLISLHAAEGPDQHYRPLATLGVVTAIWVVICSGLIEVVLNMEFLVSSELFSIDVWLPLRKLVGFISSMITHSRLWLPCIVVNLALATADALFITVASKGNALERLPLLARYLEIHEILGWSIWSCIVLPGLRNGCHIIFVHPRCRTRSTSMHTSSEYVHHAYGIPLRPAFVPPDTHLSRV